MLINRFTITLALATLWCINIYSQGSASSLSFDQTSNNFVNNIGGLSSYSFMQNTGVFTIEAWIQLADASAVRANSIIGNTPASAHKGFLFMYDNRAGRNNQFYFHLVNGNTGAPVITSLSSVDIITDTDWHHVAVVGDGTNITFYVDGIASSGSGTMGTFSTGGATQVMRIGSDYQAVDAFDGVIDEVRIWNDVRTQAEIRDNMCQELMGNEANLQGYWQMNENADNTCSGGEDVCDLTTNNNHGVLQ